MTPNFESRSTPPRLLPDEFSESEHDDQQERLDQLAPEGTVVIVFRQAVDLSQLVVRPGYVVVTENNFGQVGIYSPPIGADKPISFESMATGVRFLWASPDSRVRPTGFTEELMAAYTENGSPESYLLKCTREGPIIGGNLDNIFNSK